MTKSTFLLLPVALSLAANSFAQHKQFNITEATIGLALNLAPTDIKQLSWIPGEAALSNSVKTSYGGAFIKHTLPDMKVDTLMRLNEVNQQLFGDETLKAFPNMEWLDGQTAYFSLGSQFYITNGKNFAMKPWLKLPIEAENAVVEKHTRQIAYTIENNLFLMDANGKIMTVTNDADPGVVNGRSVHREEFGIDHGIFFSPKGNLLAFYRMDQSMVEQYPIINWTAVPATVHYTRYPFSGRTSHHVTLGVFNPATGKTVFLDTGTPQDHYLTSVTWSPDEQSIYIGILNREQNHLWLNQYNAQTGAFVKTLFEETDPEYVHPEHELFFLPGSNNEFIWWSQRDGYQHLYRFNTAGKLLNQVTKGEWVVNEILGVNTARKTLFITSSKESPMEKHIYAVNWETGKMTRLDADPGVHKPYVSTDGNYIFDRWSSETVARKIDVFATGKNWKENLLTAPDPLVNYDRPRMEHVTLSADDHTPLYGKIFYPTHFDSTKKYPVIVYLYNGPNVQLLSNSYPSSGNIWYEYMAERGYVVFTMDGRGSSNRGMKFEQATFRQLGTVEMEDQMKGVEYLKSLPFVDGSRMGIHGWSFGGFMTTSFMLRKPGVFACAVAGGPVMDWKMYEVMYTERYMDTPQENPKGYEDANLLTKVKNLKGKLLLIHGTIDSTVVWEHSIKFLKAAVDEGVQVDYFVYPGYEHNVRGYDRVHLMQKISDYFDLYLKK